MRNIRLLIIILFGVAMAGQAATSAKAAASAKAKAAHPAAVSDADLEKAIRAKFAASKISADKFTAHVQGGVATLSGHTDVLQHKGTATRLAKTAGALAVVNNIEISQAAKDKAAKNLVSGRRRAQVKRTETVARSQ
jgi:osmotically-inducible protein OsmY